MILYFYSAKQLVYKNKDIMYDVGDYLVFLVDDVCGFLFGEVFELVE